MTATAKSGREPMIRPCAYCGKEFNAARYSWLPPLKFCGSACAYSGRAYRCGDSHYAWKGDAARPESKRCRARKIYPRLGRCEGCGAPATDRHHRSGDTGDNRPENIAFVCRRCHMTEDGRLERLTALQRELAARPRILGSCVVCGRVGKRSHGRCHRCDMFRRTHDGRERPNVSHVVKDRKAANAAKPCVRCGLPAGRIKGEAIRGHCLRCYWLLESRRRAAAAKQRAEFQAAHPGEPVE